VDLGAGFRLTRPGPVGPGSTGGEHAGHWTYGLPELPRRPASRSAPRSPLAAPGLLRHPPSNPGPGGRCCWPAGLAEPSDIVIRRRLRHVRRGAAPPTASLMGSEVMGSVSAYKAGGVHRHTPEIEQALQGVARSRRPAGAGARSRSRSRRRWPPCRAASWPPPTARLAGPAGEGGARGERGGGHRAALREAIAAWSAGENLRAPCLPEGPVAQQPGRTAGSKRGPAPGGGGTCTPGGPSSSRPIDNLGKGRGRPGAAERQPHARPAPNRPALPRTESHP